MPTDSLQQPAANIDHPAVVLFDGSCGMCDKAVQFILARDSAKRFRFAPLQSDIAKDLMRKSGIDPDQTDSMVLIENDRAFTKSSAALKIALELREPWPLVCVLAFVPIDLRDRLYDYVARHRHQWFSKPAECRVPTEDQRELFL